MIKFNPKNKTELSFEEQLGPAMEIKIFRSAKKYLADYIAWVSVTYSKDIEEASKICKESLGYWAGYYSPSTRRRVERLFECEHPYFGSIAKNGQPTAKEAFEMGVALGEKMKQNGKMVQ